MTPATLSAVRKLVGEARRAGVISGEEASQMIRRAEHPAARYPARELVDQATGEGTARRPQSLDPQRQTGLRDPGPSYGVCAAPNELAELDVLTVQLREGRWVLADLEGKGRRVRTVAVPIWIKQGINAWITAAAIEDGRLLRSIRKGGKKIGIEHLGAPGEE